MKADPTVNAIVDALDHLIAACGLDRSESATEKLFDILAATFETEGATRDAMETTLRESHQQGLCYDMRWPIAQSIAATLKETR